MVNSDKTKKKLSVALCVRNEEEKLKKCLDALTFADEIIILLDGCSDSSKEIANKYPLLVNISSEVYGWQEMGKDNFGKNMTDYILMCDLV